MQRFWAGVFGVFFYYKLKRYVNLGRKNADPAHLERLEYYERQLIEMKIRLDALDVTEPEVNSEVARDEVIKAVQKIARNVEENRPEEKIAETRPKRQETVTNAGYLDITDYVLRLITERPMTSRDVQIAVKRTREHASRLMKKLFEDGFVNRHTETKPYTYSITEKGMEKIGLAKSAPTVA